MSNFSPTPSGTVQRPDIAMTLSEFMLDRANAGMIADQVLPIVEVPEKFGNYGLLRANELAQDHDIERAPGSGYKRLDFKITQSSYSCQEYGPEVVLDQNFLQAYKYLVGGNADAYRMIAAAIAQNQLMLAREKRVAAAVFNASTFSSYTTSVSTEWSTVGSATPITDVHNAKQAVRAVLGPVATQDFALIISSKVRDNLRRCAQIQDLVKYVKQATVDSISDSDIAGALGVGRLLVGDSMRPTHAQGGTAAFVDVWDDEYAMLAVLAPNGSMLGSITKPALGRTFHWGADGSRPTGMVESYFNDEVRAEVIRVRHEMDELIEVVPCGHLLSNITA